MDLKEQLTFLKTLEGNVIEQLNILEIKVEMNTQLQKKLKIF